MSQNRFLLSVLLVTATLSVCAAIECAQCMSPILFMINGIAVGSEDDTGEDNCEAKTCTDVSARKLLNLKCYFFRHLIVLVKPKNKGMD